MHFTASDEYITLAKDKICKDVGYEYVDNGDDCENAARNLGKDFGNSGHQGEDRPKGCIIEQEIVYFNMDENDVRHGLVSPICRGKGNFRFSNEIFF